MVLDRIPPELKKRPQWVCWRPDKTPVDPKTGGNAKANDPATWADYGQALRHYKAHRGNAVAGIGFEFSMSDPFTGIDVDKCRDPETGEIEEWARAIIKRLNSYTEVSPSGRGVHIIIKGKLPPGGNRKGRIELYSHGRYFTMSGLHLDGTPTTIEPRQAELEDLHRKIFGQPQAPRPASPSPILDLSDKEVLDKARRAANGVKFAKLWVGDWQGDYKSPSEATAALLNTLVFYCGPDPARVDRLFRQSGLMRPKWDRPQSGSTWGALEVEKAISRATEFYQPSRRSRAPDSNRGNGEVQARELRKPE